MRSTLVLLSKCQNLILKLLRWLLEIKKNIFLFLKWITLCWQEVLFSLLECLPRYDITLRKYVIQFYNPAIALRHIICKNSTKDDLKISTLILDSIHSFFTSVIFFTSVFPCITFFSREKRLFEIKISNLKVAKQVA